MAHRVAPEAKADLAAMWHYVARESGSAEVADRLIDSVTARFLLLGRNPYIGRRRDDDLRPGLRSFAVGGYVILYRVADRDVLILRVVSGRRDLPALLRE
jgi:toxin ParE1/3/4